MPKRKVFSGESCCDLLRNHGFGAVRQKGSHRVMQKKEGSGTITARLNKTSVKRPLFIFTYRADSISFFLLIG
jgi:predicted RNA binding protein YcfA (HicA-like mRNA interferase family)